MLIAAAVCPHPPLLVPEVTGAQDPGAHDPGARELGRLRAACRDQHLDIEQRLPDVPELTVAAGGRDRWRDR